MSLSDAQRAFVAGTLDGQEGQATVFTATQIAARAPDPEFQPSEVQGGILERQGKVDTPVRQGALSPKP